MKTLLRVLAVVILASVVTVESGGSSLTDCYQQLEPCSPFFSGGVKLPAAGCCHGAKILGHRAVTLPGYEDTLCQCFKAIAGAPSVVAERLYALPGLCAMEVDPRRGVC